jgi:hypothetical protein
VVGRMSRRHTVVVTASGLYTSMLWWWQLAVVGRSVVARVPCAGERPSSTLVLATCRTIDDVHLLFDLISERLAVGAPVCDVHRLTSSLKTDASSTVVDLQETE